MNKKEVKAKARKVWHFIWEDDSLLSWAVNIALAFLLIKFIVYPGLGLLLGTNFPVVAVVSGSMEHKLVHPCSDRDRFSNFCTDRNENLYELCGVTSDEKQRVNFDFFWDTCGGWYNKINLTKQEFSKFPFKNGFNTGDIMILFGTKPEKIDAGDVIVFKTSTRPDPIIHRVVLKWSENGELFFQTKGDHNSGINTGVNEGKITEDRVIGKAVIRVPYLGWIKILAVKFINGIRETFI